MNYIKDIDETPIKSLKQISFSVNKEKKDFPAVSAGNEILFLSSFPPNECGIATYTQDLIAALSNKFDATFAIKVCAIETSTNYTEYGSEVKYVLDANDELSYHHLSCEINDDEAVKVVVVQHEFGFFQGPAQQAFLSMLLNINKPVIVVFHTVLPTPTADMLTNVVAIGLACDSLVVMTKNSAKILMKDYGIGLDKIHVIPHGTHLIAYKDRDELKRKYGLEGRVVLSTFGLLSSGKNIETTLLAMPGIISKNPDALFLILGKTHPSVIKNEGEAYREKLERLVESSDLKYNVKFVNKYLPLPELLEYLQMTDIYLFTSKDPNQAVSGTFSYAMSCGCPIISTPIPHAVEVLRKNTGILIDFQNSDQLENAVCCLLSDHKLRGQFIENTLHRIVYTSWENSAIAHAQLFNATIVHYNSTTINNSILPPLLPFHYKIPAIDFKHIKNMTTSVGIIQFSKLNQADINSGYTLDDNARALIAMTMHFELSGDKEDLIYLRTYLDFIKRCQLPEGNFNNYLDEHLHITKQNEETNLSDSNGRAIWALGFLILKYKCIDSRIIEEAEGILIKALPLVSIMYSTRSMAFTLKGLYFYYLKSKDELVKNMVIVLANRLVQMYKHEADNEWLWFESYLTYANSLMPEALLCAWLITGNLEYRDIAKCSFDFLLQKIFKNGRIKVISNQGWLHKGSLPALHGEQPIDVAYTILALDLFYTTFGQISYLEKMETAFNWFLGANHLHQIIYNPCTGGCCDGLERKTVNLNQGAESSLSYLMARLTIEKYRTLFVMGRKKTFELTETSLI